MGVGTGEDPEAVDRGVDFFSTVFTRQEMAVMVMYIQTTERSTCLMSSFQRICAPSKQGCQCPACRSYSRAYIRHLLKAKEMLGMRLCVLHNLYFYNTMMTEIRKLSRTTATPSTKRKVGGRNREL